MLSCLPPAHKLITKQNSGCHRADREKCQRHTGSGLCARVYRLSTMLARGISNLRMVNGSAENPATHLVRWGNRLLPTDQIPDPHKLAIKLLLNGVAMQDSNTDQLIFGVPELIEFFLSQSITLEPGDVIATWHSGQGWALRVSLPVYLKPGDKMEVVIDGIGVLGNKVVAAGPR